MTLLMVFNVKLDGRATFECDDVYRRTFRSVANVAL